MLGIYIVDDVIYCQRSNINSEHTVMLPQDIHFVFHLGPLAHFAGYDIKMAYWESVSGMGVVLVCVHMCLREISFLKDRKVYTFLRLQIAGNASTWRPRYDHDRVLVDYACL